MFMMYRTLLHTHEWACVAQTRGRSCFTAPFGLCLSLGLSPPPTPPTNGALSETALSTFSCSYRHAVTGVVHVAWLGRSSTR